MELNKKAILKNKDGFNDCLPYRNFSLTNVSRKQEKHKLKRVDYFLIESFLAEAAESIVAFSCCLIESILSFCALAAESTASV